MNDSLMWCSIFFTSFNWTRRVACEAGVCQSDSQLNLQLNGYSGAGLASKIDTLFESTVPSFSFASTDKCDAIVKLSAESFTSMVKDFDTSIKFNASTAEEYIDLHVVPESL